MAVTLAGLGRTITLLLCCSPTGHRGPTTGPEDIEIFNDLIFIRNQTKLTVPPEGWRTHHDLCTVLGKDHGE